MFSKHSPKESKIEVESEEALPTVSPQENFFHSEPKLDYSHYELILDPESEFPWHHPDSQIQDAEVNVPEIDMTQFHDPWEIYRGHIPPNSEVSSSRNIESQKADDHEEIRKYAWDYISPQHYQSDPGRSDVQSIWSNEQHHPQTSHDGHAHDDFQGNVWDYDPKQNYSQAQQYSQNIQQHTHNNELYQKDNTDQYSAHNVHEHLHDKHNLEHVNYESSDHSQCDSSSIYQTIQSTVQSSVYQSCFSSFSQEENDQRNNFGIQKDRTHYPSQIQQNRIEQVYYTHVGSEKMRCCQHQESESNEFKTESKLNGHGEADFEIFENLRPRHPYDGFYLRHRMTIDSRGRKVCMHEVPPTPTPSPPESPVPGGISLQLFDDEVDKENRSSDSEAGQVSSSFKDVDKKQETGVAGNFARVVLGAGAQREALDDLTRRQGWEAGNIDYMGADAFDNIWAKISQTLSQPRSSPPKQSSPPPAEAPVASVETPAPIEALASVASVEAPAPIAPTPVSAPVPADPAPTVAPAPVPAPSPVPASTPAPIPEPVKPAESPKPAPKEAPISPVAAAPELAKVVAAAPAEPKPAAEAPVIEAPVAPAVPVKAPAAIPSKISEDKKDPAPAPSSPVKAPATPSKPKAPKTEVTPAKNASSTDSPPLANTPSKEELPEVPAAKSEERRKPAGKLQLPPAAADPLPTPDSELEDAATLAHAIIAGELRTPTVTSPSPPADPASPRPLIQEKRLSVEEPAPPTPPAGAVSLSQIGVKPQATSKATIAAQIESSVSEAAADPPKKKVVKKVLKKDGGDAPVPPPRKKEKKPKDK